MPEAEVRDLPTARPRDVAGIDAWARLREARSLEAFGAAWLNVQAGSLPGATCGVLILGPPETGPFIQVAMWPNDAQTSTELSFAAEAALAGRKGVVREGTALTIAFPVLLDDRLHGVAAFELATRGRSESAAAARALQWGLAWVEAAIRRATLLPNRALLDAMDAVAVLLEAPSGKSALPAVATEIARTLSAGWVAIATARNGTIRRLDALTTTLAPNRHAELVQGIEAAMQEALDQGQDLTEPAEDTAPALVRRAHRQLAELTAPAGVASTLIVRDGAITGVITCCAGIDAPLDAARIAFLRQVAALIGPAIALRQSDDRSILRRSFDAVRTGAVRLFGPRHVGIKLAALGLLAAAILLPTVRLPHRIGAQVRLEGAEVRVLTAPIQGYVASAPARAGDLVNAGAIIARLDDRDLRAERARWAAEREKAAREHQRAMSDQDRTRVQVQRAQIDQAQARVDLLDEQLARIDIRAPFDGLLVRGDLSQSLGAAVQRGEVLFEIAPRARHRIVLGIDERDIAAISAGQQGSLLLSSFPDRPMAFTVSRITPIAATEDGRNLFKVEAEFASETNDLRPGMQGSAYVEAGERSLLDLATLRLRQALSLLIWRWLP